MNSKFSDFVNKLNKESQNKKDGFNPSARIETFKQLVNSLYEEIDSWLQDGIQEGKILTGLVPITISEEMLGAYSINEKWIQIGNAKIIFRPIGTILIGTNARVDLIYRSKDIMIVRTGENIKGPGNLITIRINGEPASKKIDGGKPVWKYVKSNQRLSYVLLNKKTFENLIMELINGTD